VNIVKPIKQKKDGDAVLFHQREFSLFLNLNFIENSVQQKLKKY